jgi:hypothetical protein
LLSWEFNYGPRTLVRCLAEDVYLPLSIYYSVVIVIEYARETLVSRRL